MSTSECWRTRFERADLSQVLRLVNASRMEERRGHLATTPLESALALVRRHIELESDELEIDEALDVLLGRPSRHLVVYGTLAPGRENHERLTHLRGDWTEGFVRGELFQIGWGAALGYPALRWDPDGGRVPAHLLVSDDLPERWSELDAFEGEEYLRALVPFETSAGIIAIANTYEGLAG